MIKLKVIISIIKLNRRFLEEFTKGRIRLSHTREKKNIQNIWGALRLNKKIMIFGVIFYFAIYFLLSILIPTLVMRTYLKLNYIDPFSVLRVLTWSMGFSKKISLFVNQSLFGVTGMTLGAIRWQFVFSLKDLFIQLPLAIMMGLHFCISGRLRNLCDLRSSHRLNTLRIKSGMYATPFGAFASVILNAGIWLGGCGSCGTIVGTTLLTLLGLGVNIALSGFFYFLALTIMIMSVFYLGSKLPDFSE